VLDLRIVDVDKGVLSQEILDERDGRGFTGVTRICLECETENRDTLKDVSEQNIFIEGGAYLASDGIEKGVDHTLREPPLLVLVHFDDLSPVQSHLREMQTLAQVHQIQDILLEARSAKAYRRLQEFVSYARVKANGVCNFVNVRARSFANGR
jgi:hypothetical protein